jgi:predicted phage tail protein
MTKKIKGFGGGGGKGGGGGGGRVAQESPDSLRSIAYAQVLDLVSEGEIEGLANGLKSVYFNDTPLQNENDTFNFEDAEVILVNGTQSQSYISGFPAVENEIIVNTQVEQATPVTRQITNTDVDAVRVRISVPRLTSQNTTNGDITGATIQYAVEVQSDGGGFVPQILGSAWDKSKVTIASSTLAQANAAIYKIQISVLNATGGKAFTVQYKLQSGGTWLTDGITFKDSQITEDYYDGEYGWGSTNIPVRTYTMPTQASGLWEMRLVITGTDPELASPSIYEATGNYGTPFATISGKTTSKYERSHRIQLTGDAPWDVRVRRITADSTSSALQNDTFFEGYTEIIDGKFRYPNSAIIGIKIDASQFNNIPKRSYDLKLLKVKIPSNYDPITREYFGVWDGTFKVSWTDNPAWCFYDLITNTRYGLGEFIAEAQVDKWTLYAIGQYCDELVDNGFDSTEPRYTCNIYLQNRDEAYTVVNSMASIFRGMPYWSSGSLTLGFDAPADPTYQFNNANVIDGSFNYSGSALKARHTVALVTWNDPSDNYRQKVEYVEDAEAIARFGIVQTEVVAVGCTSRGQANRVGRWLLFTERSETELVTFKTGLEGNPIRPSQVIQIADQMRAGVRLSGRIASATSFVITCDQNVELLIGNVGNSLSVILPDGSLETRTITAIDGFTLTVGTSFSDIPAPNSIWLVQTLEVAAQLFRVVSASESNGEITITALEHNPLKYSEIETGLKLAQRPITVLSEVPAAPQNLSALEELFEVGSDVNVQLSLSWERVVGAVSYEVSYKIGANNYITLPLTKNVSVDIPNATAGAYTFRVFAINSIGKRSIPAQLSQNIFGKEGLYTLDAPTNLTATSQSVIAEDGTVQTGIILEWDAPLSPFVSDYEVQFQRGSGNYDWGSVTENASSNTDYGSIAATETFGLDYGSILDPIPNAEDGFNSRFTSEPYFTIAPVVTSIEYTIKVRALNSIGVKSDFITIVYTSYGDVTPPALIENITVKSGYKQLILNWTNPADTDFDFVEIFRNIVNNRISSQKIGNIRGTSYVDSGLAINETYYYWARSVDRSGNRSDYTDVFAGTTEFIDSDQFSQEVMNLFSEAGAYGIEPVTSLPPTGDFDGQIKYDRSVNKLYRWDGTAAVWTDDIFSITSGSVNLASFASGIEPVSIVAILPNPSGYTGAKVVFLTADNKLYRYTGSAWTSAVLSSDISGTLAADKFSADLRPVEVVSSLPALDNFVGRTAVLTTDGKLYRFTSSGWSAAVNTTDLSGTISAAQISASAITTDKLDANSVTTGKIAAGAITTDKLAANSVVAGTIAAGAINAAAIATGAITADKIQAGAIQTDKIAANAITAGLIAASGVITQVAQIEDGLITNAKITNGAITTAKIGDAQITAAKILDATITGAKIGNAEVGTLKIAGNSISRSFYAQGGNSATTGSVQIFGRVHITAMFYANEVANRVVRITRDGITISEISGTLGLYTLTIVDEPSAGLHTYTASSGAMNAVLMQLLDIQR